MMNEKFYMKGRTRYFSQTSAAEDKSVRNHAKTSKREYTQRLRRDNRQHAFTHLLLTLYFPLSWERGVLFISIVYIVVSNSATSKIAAASQASSTSRVIVTVVVLTTLLLSPTIFH